MKQKQKQKQNKKSNKTKQPNNFAAEQAERGQVTESPAAQQFGATEQQTQPLTPPTTAPKEAKPPVVARKRYANASDDMLDPTDELTPG